MPRIEAMWQGIAVILVGVVVVVVLATSGCGASSAANQTTVPGAEGIQLTRVDVEGIECVVASNGGSGSIALSCNFGG